MLMLLFSISSSYCQEKKVTKSDQEWLQLAHQSKLKNNWVWKFDTGYRWKNGFDESTQYYARSSAGYQLNSSITIGAGFNFVGYVVHEKTIRNEYRPFQDLYITNTFSKFKISHRIRVEERWMRSTKNDQNDLNDHFSFRFRYRFLLAIPLLKPKPSGRMLTFIFGDEIFLNAGTEIVNNVFDQNRVLISPTYNFNKRFSLTLTYSSQFANTPIENNYLQRNLYWIRLSHLFDARKK